MTMMQTIVAAPDYAAIKTRQQATWGAGDYAVVGSTLNIVGEQLAEACDINAGDRVLDVAAGNGNASLAAARRFADVTSSDYVPALLEKGRRRADADGLRMRFRTADAEALPFERDSFDTVVSTFGAMFAPNQKAVAREMLRVCRPGGRIGMANWTPDGFIGALFKTVGAHVPPPAGVRSPALWGTRKHLETLFGDNAVRIDVVERNYTFRYRSIAHWVDMFRTFYGPTKKAFEALPMEHQAALAEDLSELAARYNRCLDGRMVVPSAYLEVVITKAR